MLRHVVSRVARQVRAHDWNPAPARTRAPSPGWGLFWKISRVCERSHLTLPPNLHVPIAPQARAPVYQSVSVRAMADSAVSADDTSAACSSCEGPVDGTLGRCEGFGKDDCRSCFDDRPPYFAAPWEFEGTAREAVRAIQDAIVATGGRLQGLPRGDGDGDAGTSNTAGANDDTAGGFYVRGVFGGNDSIVLEFLVDESDAVCEVRGTQVSDTKPRVGVPRFGSPVDRQLELVRKQVGWLEVPILRNRKINALVGMETPWDSFGPTPPPTMDEMYGSDARRLDDPLQ